MDKIETGSNNGGNLVITTLSDVGGTLATPLRIKRSNGYVGLGLNATDAEATERLEVAGNLKVSTNIMAHNGNSLKRRACSNKADGANAVSTWTNHTTSVDGFYTALAYSPELGLYVCFSQNPQNTFLISYDGLNWSTYPFAANVGIIRVVWCPERKMFCGCGIYGNNMISPNGLDWTVNGTTLGNSIYALCWSPDLSIFVALAAGGTNRCFTSQNGQTWAQQTTTDDRAWNDVIWIQELSMFVAVAASGPELVEESEHLSMV